MTDHSEHNLSLSKGALRKTAREARARRAAMDTHAAARLAGWADYLPLNSGDVVGGYAPIGTEIDILPLLDKLRQRGHTICLATVVKKKAPLVFRRWDGGPLVPGPHGTSHPDESQPEFLPDFVLVPLLGFDRRGYRLGYGGGYYDRTLNKLRHENESYACGVAYAAQELDAVPFDQYDEELDAILTEDGFFECETDDL